MAYTRRTGPHLQMVGNFDTLANLNTLHPASEFNPGTIAWCDDVKLQVSDGVNWGSIGPKSTAAENYGALSTATGAVNVAAINAALALGGVVTLNTPGTYTIGKSSTVTRASTNTYDLCLVIPSNTSFVVGPQVTLKLAAGLNNPCLLQNSNLAGGNTNISITGGIWDGNCANTTRTDGTDFCCIHIWLQNITDLKLRDMTVVNPNAWGIGIAACTRVRTDNTRFEYTTLSSGLNQGGFQFEGPNNDVIVRDTFGNTYDDLVAFVTEATSLYTNTMAGYGPALNILVDGVIADTTSGCLHLVRLQDSIANPITKAQINNLVGRYTDAAVVLSPNGAGGTAQLNEIGINGIRCSPLSGTNPSLATIEIVNNCYSLDVMNFSRQYNDGGETTKRPCIHVGGTVTSLKIANMFIRDITAAGANVAFINAGGGIIGNLQTTNIEAVVTLTTGSNVLVQAGGVGSIGRWLGSNIELIRVANALVVTGSGAGISQKVSLSNVYSLNNQAPFIKTSAAIAFPLLQLSNVQLDGTQGGASGCISFTGLSGTCFIQMNNCLFSNGANVNIVRSAAEAIRVQSMSTPVPSGILTQAVGDIFLDSSNSNNPYRCSTAPSTFTAL